MGVTGDAKGVTQVYENHLSCFPFGIEAGDGTCSLFYQFGQFHCVTDVSTSLDMTKESSLDMTKESLLDMTNVSSFKMEYASSSK